MMLHCSVMMNLNLTPQNCNALLIPDSRRGVALDSTLERAASKDIALVWKRTLRVSKLCQHRAGRLLGPKWKQPFARCTFSLGVWWPVVVNLPSTPSNGWP